MHWKGHIGAALLAYAPLGTWLAQDGHGLLVLVGAAVMVALASLPDVDQSLPLVAHRSVTHTVPFALLVGGAVAVAGATVADLVAALGSPAFVGQFGFVVGVSSVLIHVAVDALTPMGVKPLWPLSGWHISLGVTPSKSPIANYTFLVAGVLASAGGYLVVVG